MLLNVQITGCQLKGPFWKEQLRPSLTQVEDSQNCCASLHCASARLVLASRHNKHGTWAQHARQDSIRVMQRPAAHCRWTSLSWAGWWIDCKSHDKVRVKDVRVQRPINSSPDTRLQALAKTLTCPVHSRDSHTQSNSASSGPFMYSR